jgi:hypothetical protein
MIGEIFDGCRRIVACIQRMSGFYNRPGRTLGVSARASCDEKASTLSSMFQVLVDVDLLGLEEPGKLFHKEPGDRGFLAFMLQECPALNRLGDAHGNVRIQGAT